MKKIQIVVFSFNRALQLDTLLCTMQEHWKRPDYQLSVVYNTSNEFYQQGYDLLINKMSIHDNIRFYKEQCSRDKVSPSLLFNVRNLKRWLQYDCLRNSKTNFRSLTISILKQSDADFVMFMTDDSMFVDDVDLCDDVMEWIADDSVHNQYSLRVGIGMDDHHAHYTDNGDYLSWNFNQEDGSTNWGYHFSVDAHIYSKSIVLRLFEKLLFVNPNTLEAPCREYARRHGWLINGRGPKSTKLLSFPINMVQTVSKNETLGVSTARMNQYYLDGYIMRYPLPETPSRFQQYPHTLLFFRGKERIEINMIAE